MRALMQRVAWAEVEADASVTGRIGPGLLVYVGIAPDDTDAAAEKLAEKVASLRVFEDEQGKLNRSVRDKRGGVLAVPSFTLMADARKGRRPSFTGAAQGKEARRLYESFLASLSEACGEVASGRFGATMTIRSEAAGPVNIVLDISSANA